MWKQSNIAKQLPSEKTRQGKTKKDKNKTRQDKTRQIQNKTRQDKAIQDKARQDKTRQDKTRQDKTRQDKARQGKARQAFCCWQWMKTDIYKIMECWKQWGYDVPSTALVLAWTVKFTDRFFRQGNVKRIIHIRSVYSMFNNRHSIASSDTET